MESKLPEGKTCRECTQFARCEAMFECDPDNRECERFPPQWEFREPIRRGSSLRLDATHNLAAFTMANGRFATHCLRYDPQLQAIQATNGRIYVSAPVEGEHGTEPALVDAAIVDAAVREAENRARLELDGDAAELWSGYGWSRRFSQAGERWPQLDAIPQTLADWEPTVTITLSLEVLRPLVDYMRRTRREFVAIGCRPEPSGQVDTASRFAVMDGFGTVTARGVFMPSQSVDQAKALGIGKDI